MTDFQKRAEADASGFVLLSDYVPGIVQEIRYFSTYNFVGDRIDGYEAPCALLTREDLDQRMKPFFYPGLEKQELFQRGYIASKSSHSRGSTVDLTLLDMRTGKELDMGSPFDYFSELSHPDCRAVTEEQFRNRMLLQDLMTKNGFQPIDCEWWHFTLENEPYPDTYFSFPVSPDVLRR